MATASTLERFYKLRELQDAGLGDRTTLTKLIHDGVLPAVKVGNAFRVRESDIHLIAKPVDADVNSRSTSADYDELATLAAQVVSTWPQLSPERKAELGRLLSAA